MRGRVFRTHRAQKDVDEIAAWIARDNIDAGLRWLTDLDRTIDNIARTPGIGTDRGDLRAGLRSVPFGDYLIFFQSVKAGVRIVRVIHGARDYARYFRE